MMTMELTCVCGKPLHYVDKKLEKIVNEYCEQFGPYINVIVDGRTWRVPRHYIALHGIKGKDVSKLGFQEVTSEADHIHNPRKR